jgi:hypothetical protein
MSNASAALIPTRAPGTIVTRPVVIDGGRQRRKQLSQLKRAEGDLWAEVSDTVQLVVSELGAESHGKIFVPVVVLYRKRNKRKRSGLTTPIEA